MELLQASPELDLHDDSWRIYSRNPNKPPHYVGKSAVISNSIISEGCFVYGSVENSVLFPGVVVQEGAYVKDSIIMEDVYIDRDSRVIKSILDQDARIGKGCMIGGQEAIAVLGQSVSVLDNKTVEAGKRIAPGESI